MSPQKKEKLTHEQKQFQEMAKQREPKRKIVRNCLRAFIVGGTICLIGQGIQQLYMFLFDFDAKTASNPTVATLIFISVVLTAFGVYDKFAQWAGAGSAVPVTGFANSMSSAAIEHRSEGLVLGVGGNMFKLAGSVIVFGVVAAFFIGIVYIFIGQGLHPIHGGG